MSPASSAVQERVSTRSMTRARRQNGHMQKQRHPNEAEGRHRAPGSERRRTSREKVSGESSEPCPTICTVGHGTRTVAALVHVLQSAGVAKLVDVRAFPRSRANPQFNRDSLVCSMELRAANVDYVWLGDALGGRRGSVQPRVEQHTAIRVASFRHFAGYMSTLAFLQGLGELRRLAEESRDRGNGGVAIMCSETLWWRCHRRMIADVLVVKGCNVEHLGIRGGGSMNHRLWDIARVAGDGYLVYDGCCVRTTPECDRSA
ncbi:HhH-GPD domain-containing protein [Metarhizium guizhouense ARSEF 977]|uniref:HhH-GPD domain-containing protein n=1 Tax=Metarhizium guizhouense (strain ARSEF 977) TaxID=1276136 RepID=A0A0B4HRE7_METGA|nr:HhH-GPD domain-containing protein [Metarhizium guizhouense ARSEF 977]